MPRAYYNEIDPFAAEWIRRLIAAGLVPAGDVDERSIRDVRPADIAGYDQCHFFAGIAGWAYAARLAGWPDDRPLWTGSCPCQPYSVAGKGKGAADKRHLWPEFARLIRECRPAVVMGEQVAAAVGKHWLDGVCADLEAEGYACGAAVAPACAVDAPHRRDRLWFVAHAELRRRDAGQRRERGGEEGARRARRKVADRRGDVAHASRPRSPHAEQRGEPGNAQCRVEAGTAASERRGACRPWLVGDAEAIGSPAGPRIQGADIREGEPERSSAWRGAGWIIGADGKARRLSPGLRLLAYGVPGRVGRLRAYGNAIVPQLAAEVIAAFMDTVPA